MLTKRFNRYELKYLIHSSRQKEFEADLRRNMVPDPLGAENGSYRVTSLYYDSVDLKCFRSKVDGLNYRRKLRVRLYGDCDARFDAPASTTALHSPDLQAIVSSAKKFTNEIAAE